jgi:hypothetical protein
VQGALDKNIVWVLIHEAKNKLHLWAPPPLVGDAALEELLKARHKRTGTFHVVLIPRLLAPRWCQLFNKSCDFTFVVSPIVSFWPPKMYELFWVGIILPFSSHRPWCFKRAHLLVEMARNLREVLSTGEGNGGGIFCRNFSSSRRPWPACQSAWHAECYTSLGNHPTFPLVAIEDEMGNPWHKEEEMQKMLSQGVDGAHMCTPFQCEMCWMRNLERRDPIAGDDDVYVACIKRANLDAMLGKSPLIILNHARETRAMVKNATSTRPHHITQGVHSPWQILLKWVSLWTWN